MSNKFIKPISQKKFTLHLNEKPLNIHSKRIKGFKEFMNELVNGPTLVPEMSFFIYNEKNIATIGLSERLDIIWVNWDGKVINMEKSFEKNKISASFQNTKYIYILKENSINENRIIKNDIITHVCLEKKSIFGF